jgi:hypothetical protein
MPCQEWKRLAQEEETHRTEYRYFAYNKEMAGVSETKRTQLMKEHMTGMNEAGNGKFRHKQTCSICSQEPASNFVNPDIWNKGS